jgi:signal transduction histidine kinase
VRSAEAAATGAPRRRSEAGRVDLRGRVDDDALARRILALVRRNEALEDLTALVAHELQNALLAVSDRAEVRRAMDLLDELLEVARGDGEERWSDAAGGLEDALGDLPQPPANVMWSLAPRFPLPRTLLRVVLRNFIANAVAAGARTVRVATVSSGDWWTLAVDDDGVGLRIGTMMRHPGGNGIGLGLCRRIAERRGGSLELTDSPLGGTQAALRVPGALP